MIDCIKMTDERDVESSGHILSDAGGEDQESTQFPESSDCPIGLLVDSAIASGRKFGSFSEFVLLPLQASAYTCHKRITLVVK
jgi:hypothetical protein